MDLTFTPHKDSGSPTFTYTGGIYTISYDAQNTGRYLSPMMIATPGTNFKLKFQERTSDSGVAETVITYWQEGTYKYLTAATASKLITPAEDFRTVEYSGTIPAGSAKMRIELRSWTGHGSNEWKDLTIEFNTDGQPPPPPPPPAENQYKVHGFISGRYIVLETTNLPTLGPDEIPVEWPKYPVSGVIWQDTISLWIDKAA